MSNQHDIVQILRELPPKGSYMHNAMQQAADEIESLRQQLATVSKAHADLTKMYNLLAEDRTEIIKERDDFERKRLTSLNVTEVVRLEQQLAECERDAHDLWMMLDNIDTIDDMAKHDEKLYRAMVRKEHAKRFDDRFKWVMNYIDAIAKVGADKTATYPDGMTAEDDKAFNRQWDVK